MAQSRLAMWDGTNGDGGGGRRKKVYGYLKAANELRQSYAAQWTAQRNGARGGYDEEYYMTTPGAFSDVEIARAGDEEMVIFPSYARRLAKGQQGGLRAARRRDSDSSIDDYHRSSSSSDEEERWDEYEAENAVVDVDVRGWIYMPHRQPMSRKQRLMITAARKLSGVPAPNVVVNDAAGSGSGSEQRLAESVSGKGEEEAANQEVQSIINKAESDADAAWKGNASEGATGRLGRSITSTPEPSQMTRDELSLANAHLMERLQPFLCNPMAELPVTAFFFNGEKSQSRNIVTDESGHFFLRVGLPFVPTHVRVLASENLSTAKEVDVLEPAGVSVISDIDDTVKHSAIASGAREIFRNTFVRELGELTIDGVSEWYSKLAEKGVEFHYVSSAPWQLYPLLERYFKLVGLPPGSFHLKQYSGMLQGIFEPTSERKRSSLDRILRDFPARKFILVGDSGEADLEVYTDIALENPDRILGIFIRDITTPSPKKFFEKSSDHLEPDPLRSRSTGQLGGNKPDTAANRPVLPPRPPRGEPGLADAQSLDNADLIDLRDDEERNAPAEKPANSRTPPGKPAKPSTLRAVATADAQESAAQREAIARKPIPPVPPRRGTAAEASGSTERQPQGEDGKSTPSESYMAPVKNAVSSVSSALPAASEYLPVRSAAGQGAPAKKPPPVPPPRRTNTAASTASSTNSTMTQKQQSYPAAVASTALQYASERLNWGPPQGGSTATSSSVGRANTNNSVAGAGEADYSNPTSPGPLPSKREELWRRRWERASDMLGKQGVVLGSWRVGGDVQDVCLWLVDEGLKGAGDQTRK